MGTPAPFSLPQPGEPMELQDIFVYFVAKFDHLPTPKSVSEAQITADELAFLTHWFSALYGKPRSWCDRDWQEVLTENATASSREMFGALFLILSAEICRDRCGEDAVWPAVCKFSRRTAYLFQRYS